MIAQAHDLLINTQHVQRTWLQRFLPGQVSIYPLSLNHHLLSCGDKAIPGYENTYLGNLNDPELRSHMYFYR
jgi:hypothetical protein